MHKMTCKDLGRLYYTDNSKDLYSTKDNQDFYYSKFWIYYIDAFLVAGQAVTLVVWELFH